MKTIAVLLTVHNRKAKTLLCLDSLFAQKAVEGYQLEVFLTNDGCTDGTPQALAERYPSINIVQGDGNLYWTRGMYMAWQAASMKQKFDYYLWLNDDTCLFRDSIGKLISNIASTEGNAIICGATCDPVSGKVSYSGSRLIGRKGGPPLVPDGQLQQCEIMPGNCVLIPSMVHNKIGMLDPVFRHAMGDFDYGLRAISAGFKVFVSTTFVGTCSNNPNPPLWCLPQYTLAERVKNLYSPLGYSQPGPYFVYVKRHFGLWAALLNHFTIHLRLLFPRLWL